MFTYDIPNMDLYATLELSIQHDSLSVSLYQTGKVGQH